jgi:hypothetical protein
VHFDSNAAVRGAARHLQHRMRPAYLLDHRRGRDAGYVSCKTGG